MSGVLIRNAAAILTGGSGANARAAGPDIRVRGGTIEAIGTLRPEPGESTLDASDCVVYPAWVNTHHHLFQSLLKGEPRGQNATLTSWLAATPYRFRSGFNAERFRLAARIGLVELALSGCGTVADHNYLYYPDIAFDPSAILFEEADRLGLRFVLCRGGATLTRQLEAELPLALRPETLDAYLNDLQRLARTYHDPAPDAMRRVVAAPTTALFAMSSAELRETAQTARGLGLRLHSHLSETVNYQDAAHAQHGMTPIEYVHSVGWLGADVWYAHLVKLDDDEIATLGRSGTGMAHCPQSNGRLGSGIAPVRALEEAGAVVSIGVDGAGSNEAADMISEVHAAWLMQRARGGQGALALYRGGHGEAGAADASVDDVVRWGTSGGGRVLGLDRVGRLEPGMAADIAVYALDRDPRHFGLHDVGVAPVVGAGRADLLALLVGGRTVVRDAAVPGLDLIELARQARDAVRGLQAWA
jgi:cytosine/adenosine deaminase-related metal-dependent hydrolase